MMASSVTAPRSDVVKELRAINAAVQPQALERLQAIAERNEKAAADARATMRELEVKRAEHTAIISQELQAHDAKLTQERAAWNTERAQRLAEVEKMEAAARAALEKAEGDAKHAAQMRKELQQKLARMSELAL
jgi:hypothetical protein